MRCLGIDYGKVRIGVSLSDPTGTVAQPLVVLANRPGVIERIKELAALHQVGRIVVGLPLNMDGSIGDMANIVMDFVATLHRETGIPVDTIDERLSSWEAHGIMKEAGLSRKKRSKGVDKLAAVLILQRYLDRKAGECC